MMIGRFLSNTVAKQLVIVWKGPLGALPSRGALPWILPRRLPYGFRCLLLLLMTLSSFRPFVVGLQYEHYSELWEQRPKKKRLRFVWDVIRLKILTSDAVSSLIRIYSQSWGSAVDALNTTYPSPPPDHRVLLTVVVPCAHALASTPSGCITMLYFCT